MEFSYFVGSNIFGCNPETEGVLMNFLNAYVNYDFVGNTWHIFETTEVRLLTSGALGNTICLKLQY